MTILTHSFSNKGMAAFCALALAALAGCAQSQPRTVGSNAAMPTPASSVPSAQPLPAPDAPITVLTSTTPASSGALPPLGPFQPPLSGRAKVVSHFGQRIIPGTDKAEGKTEIHDGIDYAITPGAPVLAAQAGKVLFAGFSKSYVSRKDKNEQSRFVIIQHADGTSSRYVHLNTLKVRPMQIVAAGDTIGTASESDECTSPVLHFELRQANGHPLDPLKRIQPAAPKR